MIASIQEMSSTNTQQLRVSSRTRRSWQRRGLAVLVVSAYLLQCATADIFGMAVAYAMPKVINFAMRNLPQCKSWLSKKLGTPCQRCNPKNLAPGDELADYLTERGIVLRESLPNHPDTCKRQLDDTPDPHQTKEACDASDDCQWMEFTSCDKCGGDGFVHVSDRVEGIGNYMPSDEDLQKAVQEGDYGNLLGKFKDGALAFLPAAQSYYAELANNGCPNCVCKSSKKPRKDCTDWHPTSAGKCKTDPCSNCKRMRNRRLMERLQGSSKTQDHQSRRRLYWWSPSRTNPVSRLISDANEICNKNTYCKGIKDIGANIMNAKWKKVGDITIQLIAKWYDLDPKDIRRLIKSTWHMDLDKILESGGDLLFDFAGSTLGSDGEKLKKLLHHMTKAVKCYHKCNKNMFTQVVMSRPDYEVHFNEAMKLCTDIGCDTLGEKIGAPGSEITAFCRALQMNDWTRVVDVMGNIIAAIAVHRFKQIIFEEFEVPEHMQKVVEDRRRMFSRSTAGFFQLEPAVASTTTDSKLIH